MPTNGGLSDSSTFAGLRGGLRGDGEGDAELMLVAQSSNAPTMYRGNSFIVCQILRLLDRINPDNPNRALYKQGITQEHQTVVLDVVSEIGRGFIRQPASLFASLQSLGNGQTAFEIRLQYYLPHLSI